MKAAILGAAASFNALKATVDEINVGIREHVGLPAVAGERLVIEGPGAAAAEEGANGRQRGKGARA